MKVIFAKTTLDYYNKLETKDSNTLYFLEDVKKIYKGNILYSEQTIFIETLPDTGEVGKLYILKTGLVYIWFEYKESEETKYKWKSINTYETELNDEKTSEVPVTGDAIKKYVQYKFEHAPITVDASNIKYDNTKIKKTDLTNMQEVLDQVFQISDSIRKSFATTIGSDENQTFQQVADDLIKYKSLLATILRGKGLITASATQPFIDLINKVKDINNLNILKNTKLNITAGTVKEILLKNALELDQLCMSIIKYVPGDKGKEIYSCHLDNTDEINFEKNESLKYEDGTVTQKIKTKQEPLQEYKKLNKGTIYSASINKDDFFKISNLDIISKDDNNSVLEIEGSYKPTIQYSKADIDLSQVYEVTKINWKTKVGNDNKLLLLYSTDSGKTYKSFYKDNVVTVDVTNMKDVSEKGMNSTLINSLTNDQMEKLRDQSGKIRCAYYYEINDSNQDCYNDDITITVNMKGTNVTPDPSEYEYKLSEDGKKINITFKQDGTYTILWVDEDKKE